MTRTIFIGDVTNEQKKVYNLVLENQIKVLEKIQDGVNIKSISRGVDSDFSINGYDFIHSLGHGVGLEIHEAPLINSKVDMLLKENMIVTDEPGIYIPSNFGVRIEDTVLVTKKGAISLTKSEKKIIIIKA